MFKVSRLWVSLCALGLTGAILHAETKLIFPRILLQSGKFSGVAIANPSSTEAEITLTAYNPDGILYSGQGVVNPQKAKISPNSQYSQVATQIFGASGAGTNPLWMEVTSSVDGLTGFFLDGNDALDYLDGADLVGTGSDLVLPLVEHTGGSTTDVSLVNPDPAEATVSVDFYRKDGTLVDTQNTRVPARGALQGVISTLFPLSYDEVESLRLRSDRPIVCYAYIQRQTDDSLITLAAQPLTSAARVLYFPQLAQGDGWLTSVGLVNSSAAQALVTITAYQADGTLFTAPTVKQNPVTQSIPDHGSFRADLKTLFEFPDTPLQIGWIKVEANESLLHGYVEYGAGTTRALVSAQLESLTRAIFSHQALAPPYYTGLAVLNTGTLSANVEVVSLTKAGTVLGKTQRVLKSGQREALLIQQWIPAAANAEGGSVFVKTDLPTVSTQLFGTDILTGLANVPPQKVKVSSFDPGAALQTVTVFPPLAVVETGKTLKFTSTGISDVNWNVDGIPGGNSTIGTISTSGVYTAPTLAPSDHTMTVQASAPSGIDSGGATIDVVQRETLTSGLTLVTAVAYLESLQRFFIAEQQVLSSAPGFGGRLEATTSNTRISEQRPDGTVRTFVSIQNDTVSKIIPYVDAAGTGYLLLLGTDSGQIYRLDGISKQLTAVKSGLNKPNSMALDPVTGNLLVSDGGSNQIVVVFKSEFDPTAKSPLGLRAAGGIGSATGGQRYSINVTGPQGVAFDRCTGAVYVT
ncbi:MAG: hypothetical protein HY646_19615, partial [Acidobacteria bacterium]|nr:hypothetical protein [Acidobacteriota bacterium]